MTKLLLPALFGLLTLASCTSQTTPCPTGQVLVGTTCTALTGKLVIVNPNHYTVMVSKDDGQWNPHNAIPMSQWGSLEAGDYFVQFSKEGYTSHITYAKIAPGQTYTLNAPTLQATTTGEVSISNPNGYAVTITSSAGKVMSPDDYKTLSPGIYKATFSAAGFESASVDFPITAGKITPIKAPMLKPLG